MPLLPFPTSLQEIEDSLRYSADTPGTLQFSFDSALVNDFLHHPLYESGLLHWVITNWHRKSGATFSIHPAPETERELLEQFSLSLPGRAVALFPPGKIASVSKQSAAQLRDRLLKSQDKWPDLAVSNSATLFCVDEQPESLPRYLYRDRQNSTVVSWDDFLVFLEHLLSFVIRRENLRGPFQERLDALCTILFELFKNTDEHAKRWISDEHFSSSLRGIHTRYYSAEELRNHLEPYADTKLDPIHLYCSGLLHSEEAAKQSRRRPFGFLGVLELTVFDSGPGLAQRWRNQVTQELPVQDEYDAVLQCFRKGQSSVSDPGKGYGLWKVLRTLRALTGFIRVRTNRIHVYREFHRAADYRLRREGQQVVPEEQLFDWDKALTTTVTTNAPTRGTLVSIVLPILAP